MEKNTRQGLKVIPGNERKCIWMESGAVSFKLCNNHYQCDTCQFDMAMANRVQKQKISDQSEAPMKKPAREIALWTEEFRNLPAGERKCRYMLMGEVSYKTCPNSFRCQECSYDQMMQEQMSAQHSVSEKELVLESGFYLDESLLYYRNHMWLKLERNGKFRIGIDDFARRLMGSVNNLYLPNLGKKVDMGEFFWTANHKNGDFEFASPVEGIVDTINYDLLENPDLLTSDPYGSGWLMMVEPENISKTSGNIFKGSEAKAWMAEESRTLNSSIHSSASVTMHDGAIASEDISKNLSKDEWMVLARNHLHLR